MKVGDYVRTEYGIDKVVGYRYEPEYENGHVVWFEESNSGCRFTDKDLPKSSPNIIDLIEVGDYVNGTRVDAIGDGYLIFYDGDGDVEMHQSWIKSIVTKECFESMEYKVKE